MSALHTRTQIDVVTQGCPVVLGLQEGQAQMPLGAGSEYSSAAQVCRMTVMSAPAQPDTDWRYCSITQQYLVALSPPFPWLGGISSAYMLSRGNSSVAQPLKACHNPLIVTNRPLGRSCLHGFLDRCRATGWI